MISTYKEMSPFFLDVEEFYFFVLLLDSLYWLILFGVIYTSVYPNLHGVKMLCFCLVILESRC